MKNAACQTNDFKQHWEFMKQTKTIKNKDELKKFMRGIEIPGLAKRDYQIVRRKLEEVELWGEPKKRGMKKEKKPPTKYSEDGLDISEYESISDFTE